MLTGKPCRRLKRLEEGPQAARETEAAIVSDPPIFDRDAQKKLAVALLVPAQMVKNLADTHRQRVGQRSAQILFDLGPEGRAIPSRE